MNHKLALVLVLAGMSCLFFGCGTVTSQTSGVQVSVTTTPQANNVVYIDYATPSHDYIKSVFQQTVKPGATVSVHNGLPATTGNRVSYQTADSLGMFILDIGDNVAANDTVYLVVQESGKMPSNPLQLIR